MSEMKTDIKYFLIVVIPIFVFCFLFFMFGRPVVYRIMWEDLVIQTIDKKMEDGDCSCNEVRKW